MNISTHTEGPISVIEIQGHVTLYDTVELQTAFREVMATQPPSVIVNLKQVNFMDSSGIAFITAKISEIRRMGGQLRLAEAQPPVQNLITKSFGTEATGLIFPTQEEARKSIGP